MYRMQFENKSLVDLARDLVAVGQQLLGGLAEEKVDTSEVKQETKSKKKTKPVEEEVVEESFDDDDFGSGDKADDEPGFDDDFEELKEPPKKKITVKTKKLTIKEVTAACKKRAENGRYKEVKKILKSKFKVDSIHDLEEDQYASVMKAMEE